MNNFYDAEDIIIDELLKLFPRHMIFTEDTLSSISIKTFSSESGVKLHSKDAVAVVVVNTGYKVLNSKSGGTASLINSLWRVFVVTPSELYKTQAGAKMVDVIVALQGLKMGDTSKPLELKDDVREFNEPDFTTNLFAIPSVFGFDAVISKGKRV